VSSLTPHPNADRRRLLWFHVGSNKHRFVGLQATFVVVVALASTSPCVLVTLVARVKGLAFNQGALVRVQHGSPHFPEFVGFFTEFVLGKVTIPGREGIPRRGQAVDVLHVVAWDSREQRASACGRLRMPSLRERTSASGKFPQIKATGHLRPGISPGSNLRGEAFRGGRARSGMRFTLGEASDAFVAEGENPCGWPFGGRKDGGTCASGRRSQSGIDLASKRHRRTTRGRITCAERTRLAGRFQSSERAESPAQSREARKENAKDNAKDNARHAERRRTGSSPALVF
jgi:hypothetical protein